TTDTPLTRYSATNGALASGFVTASYHDREFSASGGVIENFNCEQGSDAWFACRAGIQTASKFAAVPASQHDRPRAVEAFGSIVERERQLRASRCLWRAEMIGTHS
ncbi:hypothetical protein LB536_30510, partial [Mesorhizobium sp. ES1-3]|nr:hypothetical protein [Mesorhizobium sp. ES1-3]